jgi:hypothetical protein
MALRSTASHAIAQVDFEKQVTFVDEIGFER